MAATFGMLADAGGAGGAARGDGRAQENEECLTCHGDRDLTTERDGRTVSLYVSEKGFAGSVHEPLTCVGCHMDVAGMEGYHETPLEKVDCGACHDEIQARHAASLHGRALARGDRMAPSCTDCHGLHDIKPVADHDSPVSPLKVPYTCGKCHQEGSPVTQQREIHQDHILENFSESIHGEGLLKKGLIVAPNCASCHTAHNILPHTDPASSIARSNIAGTCTQCHAEIESVHQKVIRGELWEKQAHVLPACVDCHPPAQDPQGLLQPGDGRRRLRPLPRGGGAEGGGWPIALRAGGGGPPVTPRPGLVRPVPLRGQRLAQAPLRDADPEGGL